MNYIKLFKPDSDMDIYGQNIMDHYKNPRNVGFLEAPDASRRETNATCGDELVVSIKMKGQKIAALKFQGHGCAISQAAASILSEELVGKTRKQVAGYKFADMQMILGVPISERRYKCAMLGLRAIQKALLK